MEINGYVQERYKRYLKRTSLTSANTRFARGTCLKVEPDSVVLAVVVVVVVVAVVVSHVVICGCVRELLTIQQASSMMPTVVIVV